MKVIISGYSGAMGQVLVRLIEGQFDNIEIVAGVAKNNDIIEKFNTYNTYEEIEETADVIIDFSHHSSTEELVAYARKTKTNVVIATTGHTEEEFEKIKGLAQEVAVLHSGNYSLGVNVLVELVRQASKMLLGYDIEVIEKHHNKKVDAPSGTADMLVNAINKVEEYNKVYGRVGDSKRQANEIGVHAVRGGTIVGEHEVIFAGEDEVIEIKHTALSKKMFAKGATEAALWLKDKASNLYSMKDVLDIK